MLMYVCSKKQHRHCCSCSECFFSAGMVFLHVNVFLDPLDIADTDVRTSPVFTVHVEPLAIVGMHEDIVARAVWLTL